MKKFILFGAVICAMIGMVSCSSCGSKQEKSVGAADSMAAVSKINIEHAIALDRQTMYAKFGDSYRWFETDMRLPEFLDGENPVSEPTILVNIFQGIVESDNGADTYVWKFQHFPDGTIAVDSIHGFWIENFPLNNETIKFTYKEAFDRMMESNFPKPHSRNVVLRNPIGPVGVNAQWIFGNISEQLWVDAVTGDVKDSNPAFPKEKGFKMPLGEWP